MLPDRSLVSELSVHQGGDLGSVFSFSHDTFFKIAINTSSTSRTELASQELYGGGKELKKNESLDPFPSSYNEENSHKYGQRVKVFSGICLRKFIR